MDFSEVDRVLDAGVSEAVFPGAVVLVGKGEQVVYRRAAGWRSLEPERTPLSEDTIYDCASLTKPLATTVALMLLAAQQRLGLDEPVSRFLPDFSGQGKESVTIRHLLSHSSGLPAWRHYYQDLLLQPGNGERGGSPEAHQARACVYSQLLRESLESPPGKRAVYSDLGFLLLGSVVEQISGLALDDYCQTNIFRALGLTHTFFINLEQRGDASDRLASQRFAPTERCPWRGRVLCAEVHDDNAWMMGGVAGHAGMFSTVADLHTIVSCLLACYRGTQTFVPPAVVQEFWTRDGHVPDSTWALGWDTPSAQHSSAGELFSSHSVGHLGFTGTSVWIDLERQVHVIVLSNRVHPRRDNDKIKKFRPVLHNAVMRAVLGKYSGASIL
jgi:CubicO group peptidase (beta-lactamase class C family)